MNSSLERLLSSHKIGIDDARAATTDRVGFADLI
jgi:twitching motility protein PilT